MPIEISRRSLLPESSVRARDEGTEDWEKEQGEGTGRRKAGKTEQLMIASRHERTEARRRERRVRKSLWGVSRPRTDRDPTVGTALGREKKTPVPMDILMPLCVCVFGMSRFIADLNRRPARRRYGNAVSARVTAFLGNDSNRDA